MAALGFIEVLALMLALVWLATWYYKRLYVGTFREAAPDL